MSVPTFNVTSNMRSDIPLAIALLTKRGFEAALVLAVKVGCKEDMGSLAKL